MHSLEMKHGSGQCGRGQELPYDCEGNSRGYCMNITKPVLDTFLASFPGLPHFQFLIACSICETVAYCKEYKIGSGEVLGNKVSLPSLHAYCIEEIFLPEDIMHY